MKTIFITLVAGHIFTLILISAYWRNHKRDSTLNTFLIAKCCQASAWLLLTLRGGIPDIFSISAANTLLFLGSSFETVSILKLINKFDQAVKKFYIVWNILAIGGFHIILLLDNHENLRVFYASIGTAASIVLPVYHLIKEKNSTLLMKIMGFLYILVMLSLISRGIVSITSSNTMGLFTPGLTQTISFLSLYLVMILGNTGFILILKERTDEELVHMAYYDELTQTLNRRTFVSRGKQRLHECSKENKLLTFVLFDVDHFKKFNDQYGHDAGDRILRDLSDRINRFIGSNHLFGRYGGDEFAMLLTGMDRKESVQYLERIREIIAESNIPTIQKQYTLSIGGVTLSPKADTLWEDLYISCDQALYKAKNNGRNCIFCDEYKWEDQIFLS
jgi:diguanylate cyclase (GGDEF)-like protein